MDRITIDVVEENGDEVMPDRDEDHEAILDQHRFDAMLYKEGERDEQRKQKGEDSRRQSNYYFISKNKINY